VKISIVDNDPALLRSLELVLTAWGHAVTCFENPFAARAALLTGPRPDLLLLDYMMPVLTGTELLASLRTALAPGCEVILISGHTEKLAGEGLQGLGVTHVVSKPLDLAQLRQRIAEVDQRRTRRAAKPGEEQRV
jgi:DNA-binding response OmpR family regulator